MQHAQLPARKSLRKRFPLPLQMLCGLILGALTGLLFPSFASTLQPVGTAFIQAVKMIVVPLVFTAITLGICQMGKKVGQLGKVSLISMIYFLLQQWFRSLSDWPSTRFFTPAQGLICPNTLPCPHILRFQWTGRNSSSI